MTEALGDERLGAAGSIETGCELLVVVELGRASRSGATAESDSEVLLGPGLLLYGGGCVSVCMSKTDSEGFRQ